MTDTLETPGARWQTTYEHAFQTGSLRKRSEVTCCNCGIKVPYTESWVVVPYGAHGNKLPLPVFVHCRSCSLILDPQVAYRRAYGKDPEAGLPDPEKVEREKELNEYLANLEREPEAT